ncbi:MAG: ABC transporter permease [Armatimonadota bacterium]
MTTSMTPTTSPDSTSATAADFASLPVTVIEPTRGWASLRLRELWEYRELLYFLTLRDVKIRYKQAAIGVGWAVLQPLITMLIFTIVFSRALKVPSETPYALSTFVALLPWQLFAGALTRASASLVGNANLLTKVYFPRLIIPLSAVAAGVVDFVVSFVVLIGLMFWYNGAAVSTSHGLVHWHFTPSWALAALPLFVLLAVLTSLAVGLWLSALNVQYRDVQYVIPFLVQIWFFASPVAYSTGLVQGRKWDIIFGLNPMAGVIQGFRWALLGDAPPNGLLATSVAVVLLLLVSGVYYFKHMEKTFADVV